MAVAIAHALSLAFAMLWEILWPLILGFLLSAIVQALVSKKDMVWLLGNDSPRCITLASLFGFASSSCSYAAVLSPEPPMTNLERHLLDALAELIARDILRQRT